MFFIYNSIKKLLFNIDKGLIVFIPLLFLFFISGLLDLLSLGMIAPYINFIIEPEIINETKLEKFIPFEISKLNPDKFFVYFSLLLVFIFLLKTIFSILIRAMIERFALKNLENLQVRLISAYQKMNYQDFISRNSTEYIRNVRELSAQSTLCLNVGLRIVSEFIVLLAIVIFLLAIKPIPLIILVLIILLSVFLYNFFLKPKTVKYGEKKIEATKLVYQGVIESIKGFKEIRLLQKQNFFNRLVKKGAAEIFKNEFKNSIILNSPRYFLELIIVIFVISFLAISNLIGSQGNNILPVIGVFAVAGLRILPGASIIINGILTISHHHHAINIVYDDLKKNTETKIDNKNSYQKKHDQFKFIKLENINFKYPNTNDFIFKDLNFTLNDKDFIGIVGETGSGKTTLIDILLGLLKPASGKIFFNEDELNFTTSIWSKKVAYLPQDHLILDSSVVNNISLPNEFEKIDIKKIETSIEQADLQKLIADLPNGLDTIIGGEGVKLSGGQYKKVCLARLFYHEKEILIMDEATNSLDKKSEDIIVEQIGKLKGKKTVVIVTHNLNTLKYCDKIYQIKNKNVIQKQ